jgi:hypothetical protein
VFVKGPEAIEVQERGQLSIVLLQQIRHTLGVLLLVRH